VSKATPDCVPKEHGFDRIAALEKALAEAESARGWLRACLSK
jgi:hypothetical protein